MIELVFPFPPAGWAGPGGTDDGLGGRGDVGLGARWILRLDIAPDNPENTLDTGSSRQKIAANEPDAKGILPEP